MSFLLRSWVSPLLFGFVVADSGEASRRGSSLLVRDAYKLALFWKLM